MKDSARASQSEIRPTRMVALAGTYRAQVSPPRASTSEDAWTMNGLPCCCPVEIPFVSDSRKRVFRISVSWDPRPGATRKSKAGPIVFYWIPPPASSQDL